MVVVRARERERRAARAARLPRGARRFGLGGDETPADGCRRIALGQLDLAIELLGGESPVPPEEAVHETRKALKRLRALMRLLEGELGAKRAEGERAVLRDAAARLAGARDAEAMVSTLDALVDRHPRKLAGRRGVLELRADLERERMRAGARTPEDALARAGIVAELVDMRAQVARWELPAKRPAAELTAAGLEHIYRAGRRGRRRAGRRRAGHRALHRWRKHVKDLRYAAEVLAVHEPRGAHSTPSGEPGAKRARKRIAARRSKAGKRTARRTDQGRRRIAKVARRADRLGETLGEEHDLMLLAERVRSDKPRKRRRKRTRRRLLRAISRRRARLRARALRDGERLYARKPRRFIRGVRT